MGKKTAAIRSNCRKLLQEDISVRSFRWVLIGMIVLKLALTACQMIQIFPENAPIDDELMLAAAKSIGEGNWLGAYSWCTIAKHMFFSVWLWLLHTLRIPYLIGGQLLYLAACGTAVCALRPVMEKRLLRLLVFLVLWWSPYSTAQFTLRVYIDNIYPSLCLLFFAGALGVFLRCRDSFRSALPFALLGGLGLGLAWLTKDDAVWLVPFAVCGTVAYLLFALTGKEPRRNRLSRLLLPLAAIAVTLLCTNAYKAMNYKYYGRYIISDYTSAEFKQAISAIVSADTDIPHVGNLVCKATREKLYREVPLFAALREELESDTYLHGYGNPQTGEYTSAGIIWCIRRAANENGLAATATQAQQYYANLVAQIGTAFASGRLSRAPELLTSKVSATLIPYDSSYLGPTMQECGRSLSVLLFFRQTSSLGPLSWATPEQASVWEQYTYTKAGNTAINNTAIPYYYIHQRAAEFGFACIRWVFRILIWAALFFGLRQLVLDFRSINADLRAKTTDARSLLPILILGLLLSVVLRVGMISYIEYTSFRIGTYLLYLAPAGVALLLFAAYGAAAGLQWTAVRAAGKRAVR